MNKRLILPVVALALVGVTALGTLHASAEDTNQGITSLVQKIAQKFGLKEADVQAVFDETRTEHQAVMQQKIDDRLTQAVTDGKITEAQKQAILEKHKELQAERDAHREAFKNMTPEERRTAMKTKKTELTQWAKDQGIDLSYLMPKFGMGMRGHGGHPHLD